MSVNICIYFVSTSSKLVHLWFGGRLFYRPNSVAAFVIILQCLFLIYHFIACQLVGSTVD